jgi:multiple sugar transport system permease protein
MSGRIASSGADDTGPLGRIGLLIERAVGIVLLLIAVLTAVTPFLWMLSTSLKADRELYEFPLRFIPREPIWRNYIAALQIDDGGLQLVNSLVYAFGNTLSNLVFCSLAGYALARMQFHGRAIMFGLIVALLMVPSQSQIIPVFLIVKHIPFAGGNDWLGDGGTGLLNTYWGLILPSAATPFGIFMMRQFFSRVPIEYEESARLDGAKSFTIFWRILLPLSRPALAVLGILSFQHAWNDFVWPLILTSERSMATLQLGLQLVQTGPDARWNVVMALATLITLPVIIVYIFAQRYVVDGAISSGVKG